jgi:GNAT superfamily N-acetyltransferase
MLPWFVEIAAVRMLTYELNRPELVHLKTLYELAKRGEESGTAFIAYAGEEPVGAIGGLLVHNPFNPEFTSLSEIFWYVLPEYRETRAGYLLLKAFEQRGEEIGVDELTLSLLPRSTVNTETLKKRGFNLEELGFRKSI